MDMNIILSIVDMAVKIYFEREISSKDAIRIAEEVVMNGRDNNIY